MLMLILRKEVGFLYFSLFLPPAKKTQKQKKPSNIKELREKTQTQTQKQIFQQILTKMSIN